jgi:transposase
MLDDGSDFGRRKKVYRTTAERTAIVAESYEPGATVGGVARRHGIVASQLSSWRTVSRRKEDQDKGPKPAFSEITLVEPLPVPLDGIEIVCGAVVIRLPKSTTAKRIADIAHRLAQGT